jgi:hypothetical protein
MSKQIALRIDDEAKYKLEVLQDYYYGSSQRVIIEMLITERYEEIKGEKNEKFSTTFE